MPLLRSRILPFALLAVVLPVLIAVALALLWKHSHVGAEMAEDRANLLDQVSELLESEVESLVGCASQLATEPELVARLGKDPDGVRLFSNLSRYGLALYDAQGKVLSATGEPPPLTRFGRWYQEAVETGEPRFSPEAFVTVGGESYLVAFAGVPDSASGVRGLAVTVPAMRIWDSLPPVLASREAFQLLILDNEGKRLFSGERAGAFNPARETWGRMSWAVSIEGVLPGDDGQESRYASADVSLRPELLAGSRTWRVVAIDPRPIPRIAFPLFVLLVPLLLGIALALLLSRSHLNRYQRPLKEIGAAAQRIAQGEVGFRLERIACPDFNGLIDSMNLMLLEFSENERALKNVVEEKTTRLRLSQETLHGTTAQMRAAFESLREGIMVVSREGKVIEANTRILELFEIEGRRASGLPESQVVAGIGLRVSDPAAFRHDWTDFSHNPSLKGEMVWKLKGETPQILNVYTAPVQMMESTDPFARVWIFRDITEFQLLEEQLLQSQKMEAVGRLAGGIAHDFNNLLTAISGNVGLAIGDLGSGATEEAIVEKLRTAMQASERGASLVRQMLGYSRRSRVVAEPNDIGEILDTTHTLVRHSVSPKVQIRREIPNGIWSVLADMNQIEQVFLNICVNASDAIGDREGTISIGCANEIVRVNREGGRPAGSYVVVSITDDGPGIPREVLGKIFDPFFTTKEQGKGTGLGLSMCYGIVEQHKGWIEVDSEVGRGSQFRVYLPRSLESPAAAEVGEETREAMTSEEARNHTILIADDEEAVCKVAETILSTKGYTVLTASDGRQAVDLVRERGKEIDAIILDLTMPVLDGKEAFQQIAVLQPDIPCLICSGYLVDLDDFRTGEGKIPTGFVQKPYAMRQFVDQVSQAVSEHPRQARAVS